MVFFQLLEQDAPSPIVHSAIHSHIVGSSQLSTYKTRNRLCRTSDARKKKTRQKQAPCLRGKVAGLEGFTPF